MTIADGFPGQRLLVLPRPRLREALNQPGTSHLVVTDCGYFPEARAHGMSRRVPVEQAVILICTKGIGWAVVDGTPHSVSAGQVVVIPPGVPHSYGSDERDPWTLWWVHVDGRDLQEFLLAAGMTAAAPVRTLSDVYRVVALVEEVVQSMERDLSVASLLAASGAAWHLLALLASAASARHQQTSVIDRAMSYLRSHIDEDLTVGQLAAIAALSPSHFAALFRQRTGFAVMQYHKQLRMARARELLDTTTMPIAAIATVLGYADPFYFSRQFRAVHGTTALRYRALHKG
ncbi:MAG: AraC family transcriptional regulator [Actinomycetota bacterium]|nr:AraC family transcriptional regulator [Actinomycetota bacterium]